MHDFNARRKAWQDTTQFLFFIYLFIYLFILWKFLHVKNNLHAKLLCFLCEFTNITWMQTYYCYPVLSQESIYPVYRGIYDRNSLTLKLLICLPVKSVIFGDLRSPFIHMNHVCCPIFLALYRIHSKYSNTLTLYHIWLKIWTSTFYYLLLCLKTCLVSGKQCRPRSDAAFCGVWSGSTQCLLRQYLR